jgi:hypothetical protein
MGKNYDWFLAVAHLLLRGVFFDIVEKTGRKRKEKQNKKTFFFLFLFLRKQVFNSWKRVNDQPSACEACKFHSKENSSSCGSLNRK